MTTTEPVDRLLLVFGLRTGSASVLTNRTHAERLMPETVTNNKMASGTKCTAAVRLPGLNPSCRLLLESIAGTGQIRWAPRLHQPVRGRNRRAGTRPRPSSCRPATRLGCWPVGASSERRAWTPRRTQGLPSTPPTQTEPVLTSGLRAGPTLLVPGTTVGCRRTGGVDVTKPQRCRGEHQEATVG